jgi:hypothetical protein
MITVRIDLPGVMPRAAEVEAAVVRLVRAWMGGDR